MNTLPRSRAVVLDSVAGSVTIVRESVAGSVAVVRESVAGSVAVVMMVESEFVVPTHVDRSIVYTCTQNVFFISL